MNVKQIFNTVCVWMLASVGIFAGAAFADTYHMALQPGINDGNWGSGWAKQIDVYYNTGDKTLDFSADFQKNNNKLPDGFLLLLTEGPDISGQDGEVAVMYFDSLSMANPKITTYAWNSADGFSSYKDGSRANGVQAPDRIVSSLAPAGGPTNPTGWVKSMSSTNLPNNMRNLAFKVDSSAIQSHTALYPETTWKGMKIGAQGGIYLFPICDYTMQYYGNGSQQNENGFISFLGLCTSGGYAKFNVPTDREDPSCQGVATEQTAQVGTKFTATVTATDPQMDDLIVAYSGAPAAATFNPANGTLNSTPVSATMTWTPAASDAGQAYNVSVSFTDPHGASAVCPIKVKVQSTCTQVIDQCGVCGGDNTSCLDCTNTNILDKQLSLDGSTNAQKSYVSRLGKTLIKVSKSSADKAAAKKAISRAASLNTLAWSLTWSRSQVNTQCKNTTLCKTESMAGDISTLSTYSSELKSLADSLIKRLQKGRFFSSKQAKKSKATSAKLASKAVAAANALPTSQSTCS